MALINYFLIFFTILQLFSSINCSSNDDYDDDSDPEGSVDLDDFTTLASDVRSSGVKILDDRTIQIEKFYYDGDGPAAWFYLGNDDTYKDEFTEFKKGVRIPDELGKCDKLGKYRAETIKLIAPFSISDYKFLSVYCAENGHNFGYVKIPRNLKLPSYKGDAKSDVCEGGLTTDDNSKEDADDNSESEEDRKTPRKPVPPRFRPSSRY